MSRGCWRPVDLHFPLGLFSRDDMATSRRKMAIMHCWSDAASAVKHDNTPPIRPIAAILVHRVLEESSFPDPCRSERYLGHVRAAGVNRPTVEPRPGMT